MQLNASLGEHLASKMLVLEIKVVPNSGRQAWELESSGRLKIFLKSAPEHNKANLELIKLLAKQLKITQNQIEILTGGISRYKRIRIDKALSWLELLDILGLAQQKTVF